MKNKYKSTRTWAFVVSMSVVCATAVMAQQPAELPEQAAIAVLSASAPQ